MDKNEDNFFSQIRSTDCISYKGNADPSDVENILRKYFMMVLPTFYEGEGFPGIIVESFASGLPVIASDWKYNSEIIQDGINGLLFKTKNEEDLTSKIEYCLDNYNIINEMRSKALSASKKILF